MRTPETDEHGLVVVRSLPDCNPEDCWVTEAHQTCAEDNHHLYHPASDYEGIAREFRRRPENIIKTDVCSHRDEHGRIDSVPVPSLDVIRTFVEESKELESAHGLRKWLGQKQQALRSGLATKESIDRMMREVDGVIDKLAALELALADVELVPVGYVADGNMAVRASFVIVSEIFAERFSFAEPEEPTFNPQFCLNRQVFFAAD